MSNIKYFDLDSDGKLVPASKMYINNNTYEVEQQKTISNFEVDTLMAETISLLNQKGYKTLSSNAGHVYHHFFRSKTYTQEDLKTDNNGTSYLYVGYHNGTPVKYELISQDDINQEDLTTGMFRVTFPVVKLYILFDKQYAFNNLPSNWYFNANDNTIVCKIDYNFDTLDFKVLSNDIIKANHDLLRWVKDLPNHALKHQIN